MKAAATLLMMASLVRECTSACQTIQVYANDVGTWASYGLNNAAVTGTLKEHLSNVQEFPTLCPWGGSIITTLTDLQTALNQPVDILLALATSDAPVWTSAEQTAASNAIYAGKLGFLLIYDWVAYTAGADRMIPGLPSTYVSAGHSQALTAAVTGSPPSTGPAGEVASVSSTTCWTSTGAVSKSLVTKQAGIAQWGAVTFYGGSQVTAVMQFVHPKSVVKVYYSTVFMWIYLTRLTAQPDWCIGSEPENTMLQIFRNELSYALTQAPTTGGQLIPLELPQPLDTCPYIVATRSWLPASKKFIPLSIMQDPRDPVNMGMVVTVTGCRSSEKHRKKLGKDCHVDENDRSLVYVRATKEGNGGRLYRIQYFATNVAGLSCTGQVLACVPNENNAVTEKKYLSKPDGKGKPRACPNPDDFLENWEEQLEDDDDETTLSRTAASSSAGEGSTSQTTWQWTVVVGVSIATLVVALSTLLTVCFQIRSNWMHLKEEAFAAPLALSPCQGYRVSPTPAV